MQTTAQLRATAITLAANRDLRFYSDENIMLVPGNETAGARIRRLSSPLLDAVGAEALQGAMINYAIPAMSDRELVHLVHCLRCCPAL